MATRSITFIESDLSGVVGAETVTVGWQDTWCDIDLTRYEREQLETFLAPYMNRGREVSSVSPLEASVGRSH